MDNSTTDAFFGDLKVATNISVLDRQIFYPSEHMEGDFRFWKGFEFVM